MEARQQSTGNINYLRSGMLSELESVTGELLRVLSAFNQDAINRVAFAGSWTAAQVADHIAKSDAGVLKALYGEVKLTERPPDAGLEGLKATFLNFSTKLSAPEFILPTQAIYDKETLLHSLAGNRARISKAVEITNLSETCLGIPALGEITRLELIHFVIYHTQRHIHQLKNIANALAIIHN